MSTWLLLNYKLPAQPSAPRVYAWRKLKRLGAVLLKDAVWVLPDTARTTEQFQWLAAEIQEMKGEVNLWQANLLLGLTEDTMIAQFNSQVDDEYKLLLKKLNTKNPDLPKLSQEFQLIVLKDYFQSEIGKQVKEKFLVLRGAAE